MALINDTKKFYRIALALSLVGNVILFLMLNFGCSGQRVQSISVPASRVPPASRPENDPVVIPMMTLQEYADFLDHRDGPGDDVRAAEIYKQIRESKEQSP
jgi:hypothetical protein